MESLFGWSNMNASKNPNIPKIESVFHNVTNVSNIIVAVDGSSSTTYTSFKSHDDMSFAQIYSLALNTLQTNILTGIKTQYDMYGWSYGVRKFEPIDVEKY